MKTNHLRIYTDTESLICLLYRALNQMTARNRVVFGDKMIDKALRMFAHIDRANRHKRDAAKYIDDLEEDFVCLLALVRLCDKLGLMQRRHVEDIAVQVAVIDEQIGRWRRYVLSRQRTSPQGDVED